MIEAWAAPAAGKALEPFSYEPEVGTHQVKVKVDHCGICHSDVHLVDGDWGTDGFPLVPGHEIVGTVDEVGAGIRSLKVGDRVGVGWQSVSCGTCPACTSGRDNFCRQNQATASGRYGGFASHVVADERLAVPIPDALDGARTAPLLCGGVTVWTPLRRYAKPGDHVVVIGIGGLGHMAVLFAAAMGCKVTTVSRSMDKETDAKALGASRHVASLADIEKADLIIATAPAAADWDVALAKLNPLGTLCLVGASPEPITFGAFQLIGGSKRIVGSGTGGRKQLMDMLDFAALHGIGATIEPFGMDDANNALDHVRQGKARLRAVLNN